jgi:hypothetical protein
LSKYAERSLVMEIHSGSGVWEATCNMSNIDGIVISGYSIYLVGSMTALVFNRSVHLKF